MSFSQRPLVSLTGVAQLVVRNLEDDVKRRLQHRAKRQGRSMEDEARTILREVLNHEEKEVGLGTFIAQRFAGIGFDSAVPEWRGAKGRHARSKK